MEAIFFLILIGAIVWFIVKQFTSNKMVANDDYFEQAGVKIYFKEGRIDIKKYSYDVNKVTGINTVTTSNSKGVAGALGDLTGIVEISVDDFKKPIHRIPIGGGKAHDFSQRLCVALRKAGGKDFY